MEKITGQFDRCDNCENVVEDHIEFHSARGDFVKICMVCINVAKNLQPPALDPESVTPGKTQEYHLGFYRRQADEYIIGIDPGQPGGDRGEVWHADYSAFPFDEFTIKEIAVMMIESKTLGDQDFITACSEAIRKRKPAGDAGGSVDSTQAP